MTKKEVQQRVLKDGKPLSLDLFNWDENTKTFSSSEHGLVLDFRTVSDCTFKTGSDCTFKTGAYCTFDTGSSCTFKTGSGCTFDTGSGCTFDTGSSCTFDTGSDCVVVRRDIYEVIELVEGKKVKLNGYCVEGFVYVGENNKKSELLTKADELIATAEELKKEAENL